MESSPQTTPSPAGCRTPSSSSFSSFSSCSSYFLDESSSSSCPPSPGSIISSVPFSWEKLPGVPKKQPSKRFDDGGAYSLIPLLPLPPSKPASIGSKKTIKNQREDPFFAALVECSKQDRDRDRDRESGTNNNNNNNNDWSSKVSRTLSDRFGFVNLYTSCKNACAVSESIIYLPRSSTTASNYGLINRRSHHNYYHR